MMSYSNTDVVADFPKENNIFLDVLSGLKISSERLDVGFVSKR